MILTATPVAVGKLSPMMVLARATHDWRPLLPAGKQGSRQGSTSARPCPGRAPGPNYREMARSATCKRAAALRKTVWQPKGGVKARGGRGIGTVLEKVLTKKLEAVLKSQCSIVAAASRPQTRTHVHDLASAAEVPNGMVVYLAYTGWGCPYKCNRRGAWGAVQVGAQTVHAEGRMGIVTRSTQQRHSLNHSAL